MSRAINDQTFAAVNIYSDLVRVQGDYNLVINGTWAGTILALRRFPDDKAVGKHTAADGQATMTDRHNTLIADAMIGMYISNDTDGSFAPITDNDGNVVTGTLVGGTDNDWDTGDEYSYWYVSGTFTENDDPQFSEPEDEVDLIFLTSVWTSGTAQVRVSQ